MANKYLDDSGLSRMWSKVKTYMSNNYAAKSHTHTIAQITSLQTMLDGKANSSHTHTSSQITDLQTKSIRPLKTNGTTTTLPSINIGEMKAFRVTVPTLGDVYLPSGGTYIAITPAASPTFFSENSSQGVVSGGAKLANNYSSSNKPTFFGFYIRLS